MPLGYSLWGPKELGMTQQTNTDNNRKYYA